MNLKDILYSASLNQMYDNIKKLHTYVKFKENLEMESYVKYYMLRRHLFAMDVLLLYLETVCLKNKKVEDRIYLICDLQGVENEEHFRCVCTKYSQLCNGLYLKVDNAELIGLSNENKLVHIVKYNWKSCL